MFFSLLTFSTSSVVWLRSIRHALEASSGLTQLVLRRLPPLPRAQSRQTLRLHLRHQCWQILRLLLAAPLVCSSRVALLAKPSRGGRCYRTRDGGVCWAAEAAKFATWAARLVLMEVWQVVRFI